MRLLSRTPSSLGFRHFMRLTRALFYEQFETMTRIHSVVESASGSWNGMVNAGNDPMLKHYTVLVFAVDDFGFWRIHKTALASCLIYARALLEYVIFILWALGSDQSSARSWPCAASNGRRCAGRGCALIRQLANNSTRIGASESLCGFTMLYFFTRLL